MLRIDFNLVLTIINLIVLYLILRKFLFRPVMDIMEKREKMIADGIGHANEEQDKAHALTKQYEDALNGAKEESTKMIEQAKLDAKQEYNQIPVSYTHLDVYKRQDMKRSDLVRAVFEGTAFALRHVMETVKEAGATAELLRICGGGAKSRTWCQIKASMLNMPVYVMDDKSGDVPVGDALIVGQMCIRDSHDSGCKIWKI